jgi:uncharacterized protein YdeI (YjbR/CyaY-like superfamily)
MGNVMADAEELHFTTAHEWRTWLEAHTDRRLGVWLVSYKPRTGKPALPYEDAINEALCFGWIDSTYRPIDAERGALWWSPRRPGSLWASSNKDRVARLEAEGRMTDAGRRVIERAKADGSWLTLEPVEALVVPDDLASALTERDSAWDRWGAFPATAKRAYLLWIVTAKRATTRERRVQEAADRIAAGLRYDSR